MEHDLKQRGVEVENKQDLSAVAPLNGAGGSRRSRRGSAARLPDSKQFMSSCSCGGMGAKEATCLDERVDVQHEGLRPADDELIDAGDGVRPATQQTSLRESRK